ncbi:MAG: cytochrome c, partial [Planctomycetota bacterium]
RFRVQRAPMRLFPIVAVTLCGSVLADASLAEKPPRARPPEFTDEDRAVFFHDAFAELVGEPPELSAAPAATESRAEAVVPGDAADWAALIDAGTLAREVRRQADRLAKAVASPAAFRAGGFRDASDAAAMLAIGFAVIDDHADEPRWRDRAAAYRDRFAAAGEASESASDESLAAARSAAGDATDLVRGSRPSAPEPNETVDWSDLASRYAVMRRMAWAEESRLPGWTADERSLRRNADDARHEAQVLAMLAEASVRPEADDWDDEEYRGHAAALRRAARSLAGAIDAGDQPAASAAMKAVSRACVDCHADYRG